MAVLLTAKTGIKTGPKCDGFYHALRRAGRDVPRAVHRHAAVFARAKHMAGHPRLRQRCTPAQLDDAEALITAALKTIDPRDRGCGRRLAVIGEIVFNMLVVFAGGVIWLIWARYL